MFIIVIKFLEDLVLDINLNYQFKTRIYSEFSLEKNAKIILTKKQSHKIINVLRMKTDDDILIFNNIYGEWIGKINITNSKVCVICINLSKDPKIEKGPYLVFSPLKQSRTDWLIEKSTECGVKTFLPSLMKRTVVRKINRDRFQNNAIGAAEQSGRLSIPNIESLRTFKEQINFCVKKNKTIIFCDEMRLAPLISDFNKTLNPSEIAIVVGPEGGFDDNERDYVQTNIEDLIECSIGPRIYRAETAALVALALFQ